MKTSLSNVGMVLHCAPLLLNAGWTENGKNSYKYYYDGITPTIGRFIERIDRERIDVAQKIGYRVESTAEWIKRSYGVEGNSLYECIQNNYSYKKIDAPSSLLHRYITEDVPYGLVQIEKIGKIKNVNTDYISLIIDLAEHLLAKDFRKAAQWIDKGMIDDLAQRA